MNFVITLKYYSIFSVEIMIEKLDNSIFSIRMETSLGLYIKKI